MGFVRDARFDKNASCENYWVSSSGDALLRKMLASSAGKELRNTFEKLLSGSSVENIHVDNTIAYSTMMDNDAAIMGTLLFSGYLTVVQKKTDGTYTLRIPNREVLACFKELVGKYNDEVTEGEEYVNNLINSVLVVRDKDTSENDFQYFLAAILAMTSVPGWKVIRQDPGRKGYADFAIISEARQAIIIEEKVAKDIKELEKKFDEGERQIEKNAYAEKYEKLHFKLYRFVIVYLDMIATIKKV